jgi:hypothetical protein
MLATPLETATLPAARSQSTSSMPQSTAPLHPIFVVHHVEDRRHAPGKPG